MFTVAVLQYSGPPKQTGEGGRELERGETGATAVVVLSGLTCATVGKAGKKRGASWTRMREEDANYVLYPGIPSRALSLSLCLSPSLLRVRTSPLLPTNVCLPDVDLRSIQRWQWYEKSDGVLFVETSLDFLFFFFAYVLVTRGDRRAMQSVLL